MYPDRKSIFREALKAHKLKMYYSSTSLFLSQADGICQGQLFILKNEKATLKKRIKALGNSAAEDFLNAILSASAIDSPYSEKDKYISTLNRHSEVHGLDVKFGNEMNSLKALSLLTYIGQFLAKHKQLSSWFKTASK